TFDFASLTDGNYSLSAEAIDTYGNSATQSYGEQILVDNTPPTLSVNVTDDVQSLDDVVINLSDNLDSTPKVTSIALV
ncbi:Ig-like domain-containing protein, partial [Escherichia coli]|nr:Ig-like domain-containing protein [Escherichia coli]